MFWRLTVEDNAAAETLDHVDGRFVLHKHLDGDGPHLDLRLEMDGYLMGWRVDATSLEGRPWATEKSPHRLFWLHDDADAQCLDAGAYAWEQADRTGGRSLLLRGKDGVMRLRVERAEGLPVHAARAVADTLLECGAPPCQAGGLIRDGLAARQRAVERLCGLGRELDGDAFNPHAWRDLLAGLSLHEIHGHLRAFEVRFDQKYPPSPATRPERLPDENGAPTARSGAAMAIMRE